MEKNLELAYTGVIKQGQGLTYQGTVTAIDGTTEVTVAGLAGFGDDFFCCASYADWEMFHLWDAGGAGAAPQGLLTRINDYVSATGTFTITAFASGIAAVGDKVLIVNPILAWLGTKADAAAEGAVTTTDFLSSYIKQLLNELLGTDGGWSNLNNEAISSLDLAIQYIAAVMGFNGANVFNPVVGGVARTNMDAVFTALDVVLQVIDANVDWVKEAAGNDDWGFGALRNEINANEDKIDIIDDNVDWNKEALGNDTWGLGAIKVLVDSLEATLGALNTAAATGAVDDATAAMGYLKQLVTLLIAQDVVVDAEVLKTARVLCSMDFWSNPVEEKAVTNAQVTAAVGAPVVVADLPTGATIVRAIVMMKFRMVENTNAAENSLDCTAVQPIQVDDSGNTGWVTAIDFVDEQFKIAATTREGGDVIIGDNNVAARVDGNDTYDFQWLNAKAHLANIQFNDVQMGLRIWYSL